MAVSSIFLILINTSVSVYAKEIKGKNSNDILLGTNNNDIIKGNNGNDNISGFKGNDQLFGNNGNDTLNGGIGADKFDCGQGIDIVMDFNLSDGDTLLGNCENNIKNNTKTDNYNANQPSFGSDLGTAILVKTDKALYGSGDTIKIDGQVNGISGSNKSLISPINIKISRIVEGKATLEKQVSALLSLINIKIPRIVEEKATLVKDVSMLSDSKGNYHLEFIPIEDGNYVVNVTIPNNASLSKFSQFEVQSIFDTTTTSMLRGAGICFFILLVVIIYGSKISKGVYMDSQNPKIGLDKAWKMAQVRVTIVECLRLLLITGIAIFSILSLLFTDTEIGVDSPIGLVKKNATGTVTSQKTTTITQNGTQWVFNIGGTNSDNYITGIQIPTFIVIFGLLGGYFRFLYGMRFLFSEKRRKEEFYDTDKRWGDVNVMDPLSFLKHSLRSLSLFFLSPFVAVGVWLIFIQIGTTGVWVAAAGSFTMGLITEEVILTLISFARTVLVGIRESSLISSSVTREDKEKPKSYRTIPNDKSTGVSPNQQVSIEYDEEISKDSVINNFKLFEDGTDVVGEAKFAGPKSIIFTPNIPLSPDKTYTAKIESGIFDLHQNQAEPVTWTFTTRRLPILENKVPQSTEVPHTKIRIEATFNQIVNFNDDSIKVERVRPGRPAVVIPGTTRGRPDDKRTIFFDLQRRSIFVAGNTYRITLSNIRDSDDNDLQRKDNWTWEFKAT